MILSFIFISQFPPYNTDRGSRLRVGRTQIHV